MESSLPKRLTDLLPVSLVEMKRVLVDGEEIPLPETRSLDSALEGAWRGDGLWLYLVS